ncbi:hypothetical protein DFQ26_002943, partial [Actinomortierella ambigua]
KLALDEAGEKKLDELPKDASDEEYKAAEAAIDAETMPLRRKIDRLQRRLKEKKATCEALESRATANGHSKAARKAQSADRDEFGFAKLPQGNWIPKEHWSDLHDALARYLNDRRDRIPVKDLSSGAIDWNRVPIVQHDGAPRLRFQALAAHKNITVEV